MFVPAAAKSVEPVILPELASAVCMVGGNVPAKLVMGLEVVGKI